MPKSMDQIVSLCKRRGFLFQSSEIYGGLNGFWDYGPLGVELKRNVRNAWWNDMITNHDEFTIQSGAPREFQMCGLETSIIMHPQVWKVSGHFDLFCDQKVDCHTCKGRFRADHLKSSQCPQKPSKCPGEYDACKLTEPRDFNLMFKTTLGAMGGEDDVAYLRPETAQGMFVNFKNVIDSMSCRVPVGIAQIGKSFRNEITPRNFTFRSREFEQMEMEFFCHPSESRQWYEYWRNRRFAWYQKLGIGSENLILRDHAQDELSHYSVGTADVEYAFPFLGPGEYGELEGIAHRGDFDLRSHSEGKLCKGPDGLEVEKGADGNPKYKGSGKDLTYFDDQTRERFLPHVIEPAAGADRATLAFLCEAYHEDHQPDEKGEMQSRVYLKLHPKLAPVKVAIFPLIKKEGMPEKGLEIYRAFRAAGIAATYAQQGAIGKRYRRQDEIGTPWCITVDGDTMTGDTVTLRDRDTLEQVRLPVSEVVDELARRLRT
ncbi:MAG: glycine--tRNA ligase [Planctomycetia bacterium]|nr:glycine--tRNA ligase [Planctomycetia bacterium]